MRKSLPFDGLVERGTPEHQKKNQIEVESLDPRGFFRRGRVTDQAVIDVLLLEKRINPSQFSAGEMYLELMGRAGLFLRSPSLERGTGMTGKDVGGSIASRIMAISRARSRLRDNAEEGAAQAVEICLGSNLRVNLRLLRSGLDVLSEHFGIGDLPDPRSLWLNH